MSLRTAHILFATSAAVVTAISTPTLRAQHATHTVTTSPIAANRIRYASASTESLVRAVTRRDSTPLYTEEQATAGAAIFGKICAECHEKKDITSADFRAKWTGRPLFDLYDLVRTTMPDSNPGGLSRDDYANALAYILRQNGLPAGTAPVMPDSAAMKNAKLDLPPPSLK